MVVIIGINGSKLISYEFRYLYYPDTQSATGTIKIFLNNDLIQTQTFLVNQ